MQIDWSSLGFGYVPTKSHIRYTYKDGKWTGGELRKEHSITLPIAATVFHYGQALFEGMKAFYRKDGKVCIFRPTENATRINLTASHILMPEIPEELFLDALNKVVKDNIEYVPPYGTGGSLYIRPFMFGSGEQLGVAPSKTYEFMIFVSPVGPYYKGGIKPVEAYVMEEIDRAAPRGTGHIKVAGNYAASLKPHKIIKEKGCQIALFLDPATHQYIDEFGTSNFLAITKDGKYVTPKSDSILGSITNKSLMTIAEDIGISVENRQVHKSELENFAEVGACGTAVVITPVSRIFFGSKIYTYGNEIGPVLKKLYDRMMAIQTGDLPDTHNWLVEVK